MGLIRFLACFVHWFASSGFACKRGSLILALRNSSVYKQLFPLVRSCSLASKLYTSWSFGNQPASSSSLFEPNHLPALLVSPLDIEYLASEPELPTLVPLLLSIEEQLFALRILLQTRRSASVRTVLTLC